MTDMILDGEDTSNFKSVNEVQDVHQGFKNWMTDNKDRLLRAKSTPIFIQDNFKNGDPSKGLKFGS